MYEAEVELLKDLLSRGPPDHPQLVRAARDPRLSDDALFALALRGIERELTEVEPVGDHGALVVLQARTTPEVLARCLGDLRAPEAARRHLAAAILREFGGLNNAPHPHSPTTVKALEVAVSMETDEDVLARMLSAIGWQKLPEGERVLLRFAADPRVGVRRTVANNLLMAVDPDGAPSVEVVEAMHALSMDECDCIREDVFWDVAEMPELFHAHRDRFIGSARQAIAVHATEEAAEAGRALQALLEFDERRSDDCSG